MPSANNVIVKITSDQQGEIKGECRVNSSLDEVDYQDQIACIGWEWGLRHPQKHAGSRASGRLQPSNLTVVKRVDVSSPLLLAALKRNEGLEVIISNLREQNRLYYEVTLQQARLMSINRARHESSDDVVETLAFNFASYKERYIQREDQASGGGVIGDVEVELNFDERV